MARIVPAEQVGTKKPGSSPSLSCHSRHGRCQAPYSSQGEHFRATNDCFDSMLDCESPSLVLVINDTKLLMLCV